MISNGLLLNETTSTQTELKKRLAVDPGLGDLYFIQALKQTEGRGRSQREWVAPEGNLNLSILLRGPHEKITWVPHRIALAMVRALLKIGVPANRMKIKWPNDILIDDEQKIAGVLCEKAGDHVIAGIGLNLLSSPTIPGRKITHLFEVLNANVEGAMLRELFLKEVQHISPDPKALHGEYIQWLVFKPGQEIAWKDEQTGASRTGKFIGIGENGELQVDVVHSSGSSVKSLYSEEVHLIKNP